MTLQEAYDILKANARYSSSVCDGFVYLSQIRELLEVKPKYKQSLINKIHNREAVIEVDGFGGIRDLINYIYPDDPFDTSEEHIERTYYGTSPHCPYPQSEHYGKYYWFSFFTEMNEDMIDKPRIKASEFLL